jgi:hypothetical protein
MLLSGDAEPVLYKAGWIDCELPGAISPVFGAGLNHGAECWRLQPLPSGRPVASNRMTIRVGQDRIPGGVWPAEAASFMLRPTRSSHKRVKTEKLHDEQDPEWNCDQQLILI